MLPEGGREERLGEEKREGKRGERGGVRKGGGGRRREGELNLAKC